MASSRARDSPIVCERVPRHGCGPSYMHFSPARAPPAQRATDRTFAPVRPYDAAGGTGFGCASAEPSSVDLASCAAPGLLCLR